MSEQFCPNCGEKLNRFHLSKWNKRKVKCPHCDAALIMHNPFSWLYGTALCVMGILYVWRIRAESLSTELWIVAAVLAIAAPCLFVFHRFSTFTLDDPPQSKTAGPKT